MFSGHTGGHVADQSVHQLAYPALNISGLQPMRKLVPEGIKPLDRDPNRLRFRPVVQSLRDREELGEGEPGFLDGVGVGEGAVEQFSQLLLYPGLRT